MSTKIENLKFHSDKQHEEFDILVYLEGYALDYQNELGTIVLVHIVELEGHGLYVADEVHILKDGTVIHV